MLAASRQLITERRKYAERPVELARVERMGDGRYDFDLPEPNTSYDIALDTYSRHDHVMLVAGWVVLPFDKSSRTTYILHHWWNLDTKTNSHYDFTFKQNIGEDYIIDHDITWEIYRRVYFSLDNPVCFSLMLHDGQFKTMDQSSDGNIIYGPISKLSFEMLCAKIAHLPLMPLKLGAKN